MTGMHRDILIFMSDQHSPCYSGWLGGNVDTPNLDALAADGVRFDNAYTACPLCVPARMAMMSGQRAGRTGIFTNFDSFPNTQPSILHPLVAAGYETVLCGRMHFVGIDQRHGFTRRIAPDTTPVGWDRPAERLRQERGVFAPAYAARFATSFVGGGESPVVNYDRVVIASALDYLAQEHEKPLLMVVGVYGPHFPYVAPRELYEKYLPRAAVPETFHDSPAYMNPILRAMQNRGVTEEKVRGAVAAYCGLIEQMDRDLGRVRQAFDAYTRRRRSQGIFCYLSDHGDQAGQRGIFGKDTFFEGSAKIPLLFAGPGIPAGRREEEPVSILDLGPTLWDLTGSETLPDCDGVSLAPALSGETLDPGRTVVCEHLHQLEGRDVYGLMLRRGAYKYISYHGLNEMLFHIGDDPLERHDLIAEEPGAAEAFRTLARSFSDPERIEAEQALHRQKIRWFRAWEEAAGLDESERWQDNPPTARLKPELCIE